MEIEKGEWWMSEIIGQKDKRILFLGNLSHKKGYQTLGMAFAAIHRFDPFFTLHIIGDVQEARAAVFLDHCILENNLQDSIQFYGFVKNPMELISNFTYTICTSPLEGSPVGLLECMSQGLQPLIYSFVGARDQYPNDYIWKNFDELLAMIKAGPQPPEKIKKFVRDHYSLQKQLDSIDRIGRAHV